MQTIIETPVFERTSGFMKKEDKDRFIDYIARNPDAGDLIPNSGGIRKVRFAIEGGGKSGGARIFTYYYDDENPVYLLAALKKSQKSDLSREELAALRELSKSIRDALRNSK